MKYAGTIGYTTDFVYDAKGTKLTFITVTSVGVTKPGDALPTGHYNKEDAWVAFDEELERFRIDSKWGQFHWRTFPKLHTTPSGMYYVISRVICTKQRLYDSMEWLPIAEQGSKTPITDQVIGDYIDLPHTEIGGSICDVRYDMEQLEKDARRYKYIVDNILEIAKVLQTEAEPLSKDVLDLTLDVANPAIPFRDTLRACKHAVATRGDFAERVKKAQASLPDVIPNIMCGKID